MAGAIRAAANRHPLPLGLENLIEAFTVIALQDAVHPTPLFELLGIALEEIPITKEAPWKGICGIG